MENRQRSVDFADGALTLSHHCRQRVEHCALASPAQETWRTAGGH